MAQLERTTFEVSRASEYFDARELQAQTGQPVHNFATVVVKELVDNAIDACETVGASPDVAIAVKDEGFLLTIAVSDNGGGIEPGVVERILNFDTRTSDKALYRTPTRGQQGNALKTVITIPFALGAADPHVTIRTRGVRHHISAKLGAGDVPHVRHEKLPAESSDGVGTVVSTRFPTHELRSGGLPHHSERSRSLARAYHLFNPHAKVTFSASWTGIEHAC